MKSLLVLVTGLTTVITAMTQKGGMADGVIPEMTGQFVLREISTEIGKRRYKLFIPSGYERSTAVPLVVMLHGCTQDPDDIARGTRLNKLAEEKSILVVYPEQPESANPKKCWNWYDPNHQKRDIGEPALIAAITRQTMQDYRVDLNRVYVAGVSAGAAMAVIVALTYPDLFAAVGSHSGIPYGAATNVMEALSAMQGKGPGSALLVSRAKDAMRGRARAIPAIVFQGGSDHTVNAENLPRLVAQLAAVQGMRANEPTITSSGVAAGYHYTRTTRGSGDATVEAWIVDELGHAWSGGSSDGTFTDTHGPDTTKEIVRYFLEHSRSREDSGK
jgi:poly(hydroxyalkanoate) depolymerase family esterase